MRVAQSALGDSGMALSATSYLQIKALTMSTFDRNSASNHKKGVQGLAHLNSDNLSMEKTMKYQSLLKVLLSTSALLILGSIPIAAIATQYRGLVEGRVEVPGWLNGYVRIDGRSNQEFAPSRDK
jgi:hypothetical protein